MTIGIGTSKEKYYIQVLHLLNPVLKISKRTDSKEIELLGRILYYYNDLIDSGETPEGAMIKVFSREYRVRLMEDMKVTSEASFNNKISRLRKRGIILGDGNTASVNHKFLFKNISNIEYVFKWS